MNDSNDNGRLLNKHEVAAIIGYWRSGASPFRIYTLTGVEPAMVEVIINNHSLPKQESKNTFIKF